jgi:hypothetical protein
MESPHARLVADDAKVTILLGQPEQKLFLDVVRILVLTHQHVTDILHKRAAVLGLHEKPVDDAL